MPAFGPAVALGISLPAQGVVNKMHKRQTTRRNAWTGALALAVATLLVASSATATPVDNRSAALDGADRLLDVQFESGAFPWIVGQNGEFMNVQGITAIGLLDGYTLSLDAAYLDAAKANRDWQAEWMEANPDSTVSAPNTYFLAKYALLTLELEDLELAREALQRGIDAYDSPAALAEGILEFRAGSQWTNLGIWDVALFVRAAHDVGNTTASAEFAEVLANQTTAGGIVDAYDESANVYEMGLAGLLFGLSEADFLDHQDTLAEAESRLLDTQCENGSFPTTWNGQVFCDEVQTTAFSVIGLTHTLGDLPAAQSGCDFLREAQNEENGWGATEIAEINSEAVQALVACVLPVHNGVTSYEDAAVGSL